MNKQKVILDTDIGDDFDDANALALLLASPEIDLIGVVVGFGNTPERAKVACRMLYEAGREDIPVAVGRQTNDEFTQAHFYTKQFHWGTGFDKKRPIEQPGAEFIVEQLNTYPGEVLLLTIAPVTNMQDVLAQDPDALKLAKQVCAMFGSFYMGYNSHPMPCAEWNVAADIPASQAFTASGANLVYAGLDVTAFVRLKEEYLRLLAYRNSPLTDAVLALFALSSLERREPEPIIYDAVTVGLVLWPELFQTRKAFVRVDDGGFTLIDESQAPNCAVAVSVNVGEFFNRYMDRMLTQNLMRP